MVRALETKFLLFWTGQERDSVPSWSRHRAFHSRCLSLRAANDSVASNLAGSGLRAPARYLDRRLPASSTVGARQSDRACLFASGEASGSQRVRLPPQVSPQPTHPVRQYTAWHREVWRRCRRSASRLQSGTPAGCGRLPADPRSGREVGHFPWLALGRFSDHMTGISVVHLSDGHRAAVGWRSGCTSLPVRPLPAPDIPGAMSKPKGAPRKY